MSPKFSGWFPPDVFLLNGQELVECFGGSTSPSCTSGGTHSTSPESYHRIEHETAADVWHVWGKDGTHLTFTPILDEPTLGTLRWGQASTTDTLGNTVSYTWICPDADCQPETVSYNGFEIEFFREPRPDEGSFGALGSLGERTDRLGRILVRLANSSPIRAYDLAYTTSPVTERSLLSSVQKFGRDVVIDAAGVISGGTALPAQTFTYQDDALGGSFAPASVMPTTPPGTTKTVVWWNTTNASSTGYKLAKTGGAQWAAGGNSAWALESGDGYVEWTAGPPSPGTNNNAVIGLNNGDSSTYPADLDFGIYQYYTGGYLLVVENGVYTYYQSQPLTVGTVLRVEIQGGVVYYKRNGITFHTTSSKPINYPLRVDASLRHDGGFVEDAILHGTLEPIGPACGTNKQLLGDFNGDGRTDRLCTFGSEVEVALGDGSGFGDPSVWSTSLLPGTSNLKNVILADFNGDGRTDLADRVEWTGDFFVALSTGSGFEASANWGNANGVYGQAYACRMSAAFTGAGDFNGDGLKDVYCQLKNGDSQMFIGLSTGSSFQFSIWNELGCSNYSTRVGAIDFDGNGMDDWYCVSDTGGLSVYPNTGYSFLYPAFGYLTSFCYGDAYVFGDLNADATTDVACLSNGKVALSSGRHFFFQGEYGAICSGSNNGMAADVDGDGASELICNNTGTAANDIEVREWVNGSLAPAETWAGHWCSGTLSSGDFDGDGKTDVYCDSAAAPVGLNGSSGVMPDLASSIENGLGGTTSVEYTPSTAFESVNNPPVRYTVTSATVDDGRGGSATTTYDYAWSYFEGAERRFMGFEYVKRTLPCLASETSCPYVETWLSQDFETAGAPEKIVRSDGEGRQISIVEYEYTTDLTAVPATSHRTGQWTTTLDGSGASCSSWPCATGRRTYTTYEYDDYGNVTQTVSYGDNDVQGDETTSVTSYVVNSTDYIVVPSGSQVFEGVGTGGPLLTDSQVLYDGAGSAGIPPTQGLVTETRSWLDTESRYVSSGTTQYDGFGNPTVVTDATGRSTTTTYDAAYALFPESVTNGANETTYATWDPVCGAQLTAIDLNGQMTSTTHDAQCRPTETLAPGGAYQRKYYLDTGNPTAQRIVTETPSADASGDIQSAVYVDGLGRVYHTEAPGPLAGQTILTDTTFNARGAVQASTAPYFDGDTPHWATMAYDAFDRPTVVTLPDSNTLQTSYGLFSQTVADERGKSTTTHTDVFGRPATTERVLNGQPVTTRTSTYDALGRVVGMADALGNTWSWAFDSLGRTVESDDPDAGLTAFEHDDAGRLTATVDAKSQRTELEYDPAGRETKTTIYPSGGGSSVIETVYGEARSGYYNAGRATSLIDAGGPMEINYDIAGNVVHQTRTIDGVPYVLENRFDYLGLQRGITYPDADAVGTPAQPWGYTRAGQLVSIPGFFTDIDYDARGRATRLENANGTVTTKTYALDRGFLERILTTGPGGVVQDMSYSHDASGLVTTTASPFTNEDWSYTYDDLDRMTVADNLSNDTADQTFTYDAIGRITYNSTVGSYTYPSVGAPRPHAPTQAGGASYSYDPNGNLTQKTENGEVWDYVWNAENQLIRVCKDLVAPQTCDSDAVAVASFKYDPLGRRIEKSTSAMTAAFAYDGLDIVRETGGEDYRYVHGVWADEPLAREDALGGRTYYHADANGSIHHLTDQNGVSVAERRYDTWGAMEVGAGASGYGFTGREWDSEIELYFYRNRYYDPTGGRFISEDPTFIGGGLNLYVYVSNDPVNWLDPLGLQEKKREPKRTPESVVIEEVSKILDDPDTVRNEQCFSVCQSGNDDPFATPITYGTSQDCIIPNCPPGAARVAFCHTHPQKGGNPGHIGDDIPLAKKLDVPSYLGFKDESGQKYLWRYDWKTNTEWEVPCCPQ